MELGPGDIPVMLVNFVIAILIPPVLQVQFITFAIDFVQFVVNFVTLAEDYLTHINALQHIQICN